MRDNCPERHQLGSVVIETTNKMYSAKTDFDVAREQRPPDPKKIDALASALTQARTAGRVAQRTFDKHVQEHQCQS